jgi:tetratricopeptide (TPR) repeat protein
MPEAKKTKTTVKGKNTLSEKQYAELLQHAARCLDEHKFTDAGRLYGEALQLKPGNAAACMGLAIACNRTGHPAEALQILQSILTGFAKAIKKPERQVFAAVFAQVGLACLQLNKQAEALSAFTLAYQHCPSEELSVQINRLKPTVLPTDPLSQLLKQADQHLDAGSLNEAEKLYRAVLQFNPDHAEALYGLGISLRNRKKYAEALPALQQATIMSPDNAAYYNDLGILFFETGEFAKAISFFSRALKVRSDFDPAHINLGVAYKKTGQFSKATQAYRSALAHNPNSAAAHNNLGNLLMQQGDLASAKTELEAALQLKPGYQDALNNLSELARLEAAQDKVVRKVSASTPEKTATSPKRTTNTTKPPSKPKERKPSPRSTTKPKGPVK